MLYISAAKVIQKNRLYRYLKKTFRLLLTLFSGELRFFLKGWCYLCRRKII